MNSSRTTFAEKYPVLFHVTRQSAVTNIRRRGLLPASMLAVDTEHEAIIDDNREGWTMLPGASGPVWLRWQRLRDPVLASRLPASITPSEWRRFINGMVFMFACQKEADRLRASPFDKAFGQVILQFATATLLESGCGLHVCSWNNGYPDRSKPHRIRSFSDYRSVLDWHPGDKVQEVTIKGKIPADLPFVVIS